ncbi:hypothetical protein H0185_01585 [Mesobacillus maritimus]|nr:hypothetical protein [Mesobacillus maritimus]
MEEHGIPTAVIITSPFFASSKAMAVSQGIPDYPFATIPHPIAATEELVLHDWVDNIIDEIEKILTSEES